MVLLPRGSIADNAVPAYVTRPLIEATLRPTIAHADQDYVVVVGPAAAARAAASTPWVANQPGVLRVNLGGRVELHKAVYQAIFESLGENLVREFAAERPVSARGAALSTT